MSAGADEGLDAKPLPRWTPLPGDPKPLRRWLLDRQAQDAETGGPDLPPTLTGEGR